MNLSKYGILVILLLAVAVESKLKLLAWKKPHAAFIGLKLHKPKLFGLKHGHGFGHGLGHGHSGGYHSSYTHHESYHEHSSHGGGFGGFGGFGGGYGGGLGGWFKR